VLLLLQVGNILKQSPDLSFPLPTSEQSQTWLLTTYLDEDTRITRWVGTVGPGAKQPAC
jgi:hypothetical protein